MGIDRKLAGLAFLLAVIVGANGSKIVAGILFLALCAMGRRLLDPQQLRHTPKLRLRRARAEKRAARRQLTQSALVFIFDSSHHFLRAPFTRSACAR